MANGSLELRIRPIARAGFLVWSYVRNNDAIGKKFRIIIFICNNLPGAFGARLGLTEALAKIRITMTFETMGDIFDKIFAALLTLRGRLGAEFGRGGCGGLFLRRFPALCRGKSRRQYKKDCGTHPKGNRKLVHVVSFSMVNPRDVAPREELREA